MPKRKDKIKYNKTISLWFLLIASVSLFFCYPCQYYWPEYPYVPAVVGVVTFFVIVNFALVTFVDPGVIPIALFDEDREDDGRVPLYKSVEIRGVTVRMKFCVPCKFYRPPRCSHCSVCNHCIETFDHHCPWVANCIGRRNYRFLFFFLIALSTDLLSIFAFSLFYILNTDETLGRTQPLVAIGLMVLTAISAIPVFALTSFHIYIVSRGRTTNEQITAKIKGDINPFSRGCWNNYCHTLCGPQYPLLRNVRNQGTRSSVESSQSIVSESSVNAHQLINNNSSTTQQQFLHDIRMNTLYMTRTDHENDPETGNSSNHNQPVPRNNGTEIPIFENSYNITAKSESSFSSFSSFSSTSNCKDDDSFESVNNYLKSECSRVRHQQQGASSGAVTS